MEKRVSVDELAIGMFVAELDRPWIDTPFLLQGFLIQDEETLAQLRATCSHVVVDLYRSDVSAVGELKPAQPPPKPARTEPRIVRVAAPSAPMPAARKTGSWLARMIESWRPIAEEAEEADPHPEPGRASGGVRDARPPAAALPTPTRVRQPPEADPPRVTTDAGRAVQPAPVPAHGGTRSPRNLFAWLRDSLIFSSTGVGGRGGGDTADAREGVAKTHPSAAPSAIRIYENSVPLEQELTRAEERFGRAVQVLEGVIRDIRAGKGLEIEAVEGVVEDLVESMIRNPEALQLVSSLRETDASAYTHALQVAVFLVAFGREVGFSKAELQHLGQVGMLLDIGKLRVRRELLDKRGNLTTVEFAAVKQHVEYGLEMIRSSRSVHPDVVAGVAQHHERINGGGYPRGLRADHISAFGQMAGIVDTFAALTSARPYADPIPPYDAMRKLQGWSETSFRGALVQQFIQAIGIFPVGSLVELSTGETAIVIGQNKSHRLKPKLLIITGPNKTPLAVPASLDLLYAGDGASGVPPYIVRGLPVDSCGVDPTEYYLSR
jgi:HD-GYP domain-containing protein (c-di-GMP phosphodiesterase class II)